MGRTRPSRGLAPSALRRDARAKRAKETLNVDIPAILKANPRALDGIKSSQLIAEPTASKKSKSRRPKAETETEIVIPEVQTIPTTKTATEASPGSVRVEFSSTLETASMLHRRSKNARLAVLNMASPLRPGGGFLTGAQAQEEHLCMRTTLYAALPESFYRLPEVGGIYTEDILVFRKWDDAATDLAKDEQFYIDVITAAMPRMPDVEEDADGTKRYATTKNRELVEAKIRKVMSILKDRKAKKIVLSAWGCGAYRNPIDDVVDLFKIVLVGKDTLKNTNQDVSHSVETVAEWAGMEIVFAINQKPMAEIFARGFGVELIVPSEESLQVADQVDDSVNEMSHNLELQQRIKQIRSQLAEAQNPDLQARLKSVLDSLTAQLSEISV